MLSSKYFNKLKLYSREQSMNKISVESIPHIFAPLNHALQSPGLCRV